MTPISTRTSPRAISLMPIEIVVVLRTIHEERPVWEHLRIAHKRARNQRIKNNLPTPPQKK